MWIYFQICPVTSDWAVSRENEPSLSRWLVGRQSSLWFFHRISTDGSSFSFSRCSSVPWFSGDCFWASLSLLPVSSLSFPCIQTPIWMLHSYTASTQILFWALDTFSCLLGISTYSVTIICQNWVLIPQTHLLLPQLFPMSGWCHINPVACAGSQGPRPPLFWVNNQILNPP